MTAVTVFPPGDCPRVHRVEASPSGPVVPFWGRTLPPPVVTTQVDVGAWLGRRRDALIAHATQIDPNSFWFAIPDEVTAEIYPWEDYTLARSLVPTSEHETDLFEGLRQPTPAPES